jgi:hypothetical protein
MGHFYEKNYQTFGNFSNFYKKNEQKFCKFSIFYEKWLQILWSKAAFIALNVRIQEHMLARSIVFAQRTLLNSMILPLGVNLARRQGWTLIPSGNVHPFVHQPEIITLFSFEGANRGSSSLGGINSRLGDKAHTWETNFAPSVEIKNGPLVGISNF